MKLIIRLSREKIKRCKKIPEPTDIGKKIRQAKSPEDLVDITLYHGIRYKHPENLLREGFRVPSAYEMRKNIEGALSYFNIDLNKLTELQKDMLENLINEVQTRAGILWTTAYDACDYAKRNPEHVLVALSIAGVPDEEITKYLEYKFGRPYMLTLNIKPTKAQIMATGSTNIPIDTKFIRPEDIRDICLCND